MITDNRMRRFLTAYASGGMICQQDEAADTFFILLQGVIGVYRDGEKVTELDEAGTYVGEMAALLKQNRNATLVAESDVACYALPIGGLDKLLDASPDALLKLLRTLAERLDETTRRVAELEAKYDGISHDESQETKDDATSSEDDATPSVEGAAA